MDFSSLLSEAVNKPGILSKAYQAFHNYSVGNQMAAMSQCVARGIEVGPISTFKGWQEKGRCVTKGQKALALCMPVTMKGEKDNKSTGQKEEFTFNRFVFKNNWFVVSQTEGADFAHEVKTPLWDSAKALQALSISETSFTMIDGNCQGYASGQTFALNPVAALPHKTRFHEMAHIVLGHTQEFTMTDSERTPKDIKEVEAESVAYILCSILGLPGLEDSRGYIQHWLRDCEISEKSAQKIFSTADKILKAGQ
jgi:hypothetical protein